VSYGEPAGTETCDVSCDHRCASPSATAQAVYRPSRRKAITSSTAGRRVEVGKRAPGAAEPPWARTVVNRAVLDGTAIAWLTVEGRLMEASTRSVRSGSTPPGRCGGCARQACAGL
jgi:hypothetical protein